MHIELMGRMVSTRWAHKWTNHMKGAMPCHASRSSNTAKSMHVSHIIGGHGRSTRGGVAAVEGRHRLHPYHTHTHTIYPSVAFVIIPASQGQVLPPLQSSLHAHTRGRGCLAWKQLDNYGRSWADY
jgi:hypothetical protein